MRTITLSSLGGTLQLGKEVRLMRKVRGLGLPPIQSQWFEGAGDGASWRGTRVLARRQDFKFKVTGANRQEVWDNFSKLARIFAPEAGAVRMEFNLDGEKWYNEFRREGGGDYDWDADTDGSSFLMTVITTKAGSPYFTRTDGTSLPITLQGLGKGLIKSTSLNKLRLSTNNAFGSVNFTNPGDVKAFPEWKIEGPFDGFTFTSPTGEVLQYAGSKTIGHWIKVNTEFGTIVDDLGANLYGGRVGVPKFWGIPAGDSIATIAVLNATSDSKVTALWYVKKWILF